MRFVAAALWLLALAACGDRRSFDERYQDTSVELEQRARALDQNLSNQLSANQQLNSTEGSTSG
jgi:cytochrome c-type biogenesis protein CcmH/NrfF